VQKRLTKRPINKGTEKQKVPVPVKNDYAKIENPSQ